MKPKASSQSCPRTSTLERAALTAARWSWSLISALTLSCSLNPLPEDPGVGDRASFAPSDPEPEPLPIDLEGPPAQPGNGDFDDGSPGQMGSAEGEPIVSGPEVAGTATGAPTMSLPVGEAPATSGEEFPADPSQPSDEPNDTNADEAGPDSVAEDAGSEAGIEGFAVPIDAGVLPDGGDAGTDDGGTPEEAGTR